MTWLFLALGYLLCAVSLILMGTLFVLIALEQHRQGIARLRRQR